MSVSLLGGNTSPGTNEEQGKSRVLVRRSAECVYRPGGAAFCPHHPSADLTTRTPLAVSLLHLLGFLVAVPVLFLCVHISYQLSLQEQLWQQQQQQQLQLSLAVLTVNTSPAVVPLQQLFDGVVYNQPTKLFKPISCD